MALPVLDGNQSATTLSSVVTGGEHIVAHSVVSLGSQAILEITGAVSGSVVTIPSLARIANSAATDGIADGTLNFIKIGGHQSGSNQTAHIVHVSAGGSMSVDASGSSVTFTQAPVTFGAITGSASILNFPSTQTIAGTVTANLRSEIEDQESGYFFQLSRVFYFDEFNNYPVEVKQSSPLPISGTITVGNSVTIGSLPAISGTVTIGSSVTIGSFSTSVTARLINPAGTAVTYAEIGTAGNPSIDVLSIQGVTSGTAVPISISSVTIGAVPNGALTTRFGSVTTANTAQISSAVTNASRKYLLIQNVTTSSNVITIGIGFTPTTTQGIQLSAGGKITFESSYIPTGAVYILSSVTASPFTILEA